jgi:membrane fusion protein (multidrug efflux system)
VSDPTPPAAPTAPARKGPVSRRTLIAVGVALLVAGAGGLWILKPRTAETTDAAYIQADSTTVAPKVRGQVAEVLVGHDQLVRRGDPLVRIGAEEFDARLAQANADVQTADAAVAAAQAAFAALSAEENLALSNIKAARTTIRSSDAQNDRAQADRVRFERLEAAGTAAPRLAEQYRAAAISAQAEADRSRAQAEVTLRQSDLTQSRRATLTANLAQARAAALRARAALALAEQDEGYTLIRAPIDGVVGDRQAEPGDYVQPGSRLLTIVPMGALYVVANFKETQTGRMTVGQKAVVRVDALPGVRLRGVVESFAPGSGSQFALLPFEPGTGNFTKVVQRIPVRIRFDPGQPALARLRPGLSTTVTVRLADR